MANPTVDKNSREYLTRKVNTARHTLLLVIICTVVNLAMILADTGTYFLFAASIPYELTFFGAVITYQETGAILGPMTYTALVISAIILAFYGLCWYMAKKKPLWYTIAFVLFALDTVLMIVLNLGYITEYILDIVFHGLVLFELYQAISANKKLAAMPPEVVDAEGAAVPAAPAYQEPWERKDIE